MIRLIKTVVGSYPAITCKPEKPTEKIKDLLGLYDKYECGVKRAVQDQLNAGIDIVSDGQIRGDMIEIFINKMYGFDGRMVTGKIEYAEPITLKDLKYASRLIRRKQATDTSLTGSPEKKSGKGIKGIITGPCTIASSIRVEQCYSDKKDKNLIYDLAMALRKEALTIEKHVTMIQIDEPILSTGYYDLDLARNAVGIITKDITVPTAMHVCGDIMSVSEELNEFNVDILDHEFASNRKNLAILENIKKDIGFGCVDTKQKTVDSVDAIKNLIIEGIEILKNRDDIDRKKAIKNMLDKHVLIDPDCGMRLLPIDSAYQKLKNMVTAAEEVEREMKGC